MEKVYHERKTASNTRRGQTGKSYAAAMVGCNVSPLDCVHVKQAQKAELFIG